MTRYERIAIQEWFSKGYNTSPLTNTILQTFDMFPAHTMKKAVADFLQKNGTFNLFVYCGIVVFNIY